MVLGVRKEYDHVLTGQSITVAENNLHVVVALFMIS